MAQRAQERGTRGEKKEHVPRDTRRQGERGKGCGDEDEKAQHEANGRLEASTVRRGVDGGEEKRWTKSTTHLRRAKSGTKGVARCRSRVAGEAAARLRAQTQCHVSSKMSHKPMQSQSPAAEVAPPLRAVRGYGGPGLVGVGLEVARMRADSAPQPPPPTSSAASAEVSSPSSPESPETVQREGPRAKGQQRKEEAAAGIGEGGDKGGQAEASGGRTEVVATEAEGQGEGQGQQAVVRRRADPFNMAELMAGGDVGRGESVVDDILVVSESEGEGAEEDGSEGGRRAADGAQCAGGCHEVHPSEVRRKEEDKGRRGQPVAGAAGSGDSSVRTGGRGRTGKGVKRAGGDVAG